MLKLQNKDKIIENKNANIESFRKSTQGVVDLLESTTASNDKFINEKDNKIKELLDLLKRTVRNNELIIVKCDIIKR